jgi:hypothetical protein
MGVRETEYVIMIVDCRAAIARIVSPNWLIKSEICDSELSLANSVTYICICDNSGFRMVVRFIRDDSSLRISSRWVRERMSSFSSADR